MLALQMNLLVRRSTRTTCYATSSIERLSFEKGFNITPRSLVAQLKVQAEVKIEVNSKVHSEGHSKSHSKDHSKVHSRAGIVEGLQQHFLHVLIRIVTAVQVKGSLKAARILNGQSQLPGSLGGRAKEAEFPRGES